MSQPTTTPHRPKGVPSEDKSLGNIASERFAEKSEISPLLVEAGDQKRQTLKYLESIHYRISQQLEKNREEAIRLANEQSKLTDKWKAINLAIQSVDDLFETLAK